MERTLEIMKEELKLANKEQEPLLKAVAKIGKKISKLKNEIEKYKLDNGLYHPMSELNNYKGKEISHIVLVERNNKGILETQYIYNDDMFSVDENGHLYYSSYEGGVMSYDKEIDKYVEWFHYSKTKHNYVGFLEIEFEDED